MRIMSSHLERGQPGLGHGVEGECSAQLVQVVDQEDSAVTTGQTELLHLVKIGRCCELAFHLNEKQPGSSKKKTLVCHIEDISKVF